MKKRKQAKEENGGKDRQRRKSCGRVSLCSIPLKQLQGHGWRHVELCGTNKVQIAALNVHKLHAFQMLNEEDKKNTKKGEKGGRCQNAETLAEWKNGKD